MSKKLKILLIGVIVVTAVILVVLVLQELMSIDGADLSVIE